MAFNQRAKHELHMDATQWLKPILRLLLTAKVDREQGLDPEALLLRSPTVKMIGRALKETPAEFRKVVVLRASRNCLTNRSLKSLIYRWAQLCLV